MRAAGKVHPFSLTPWAGESAEQGGKQLITTGFDGVEWRTSNSSGIHGTFILVKVQKVGSILNSH